MVSYRVIQSFSQTTSQMSCGHENMLNSNIYPYISRFDNDDSIDESIKFFSTVHPYFGQRLSESSSYEIT